MIGGGFASGSGAFGRVAEPVCVPVGSEIV